MLAEQHPPAPDRVTNGTGSPAQPGRDQKGRFTAGNRMGRGNPFARRVAALRTELLARVTGEDLGAVADAVLAKAKAGDLAAARLLFSYVLGKPDEQHAVPSANGPDGAPPPSKNGDNGPERPYAAVEKRE